MYTRINRIKRKWKCRQFYKNLSFSSRKISKHKGHIVTGDFNAHLDIGKGYKFSFARQIETPRYYKITYTIIM